MVSTADERTTPDDTRVAETPLHATFPLFSADQLPRTNKSLQHLATEYIHDVILIENTEGKILYANPSVERVTGWTVEEILQKPFIEWIHPEDRFRALEVFASFREMGTGTRIECRLLCRSGDYCWMETTINTITNEELLPVLLVFSSRNITMRKKFESELVNSEERFRSLIEKSPIGIAITRDEKILFINRAGLNIWGYEDSAALQEQAFAILIATSQYDDHIDFNNNTPQEVPALSSYESIGLRQNRTEFPLQVTAEVIHLSDGPAKIHYFIDLTEIKRAEALLRESEERLSFALEGIREGFFDWNIETGHLLYSEAYTEILGYGADEFEPDLAMWETRLHPEDKPSVLKTLQDHLEGKTEFYESEHRLLTKSGNYLWVCARGMVTKRASDGTPLRMNGTHSDISKRKQMEEDLRSAREELEKRVAERTIELQNANTTLKYLLDKQHLDRTELEDNVAANIRGTLLPNIAKLKNIGLNKEQLAVVDMVEEDIYKIMSPFLKHLKIHYPGFTQKEIQIANLIRNGKSSKEIAAQLHLSIRTIDLFRYRIRKKLNISNTKTNLETYLSMV